MEPFEIILKRKRDIYGNTECAIEFAAQEYARQAINEAVNVAENIGLEYGYRGEVGTKHFKDAFDKIELT